MTHVKLTSEMIDMMDNLAQGYQNMIVEAMGIQTRQQGRERHYALSQALAQIMGWRQRFQQASVTARTARTMYLDWLENVHAPSGVYSDWVGDQMDKHYQAQPAPERKAG